MAYIALDFDHTMVHGKEPLPRLREGINLLREKGHKIIIHSCNDPKWIEKVLNDLDVRYDLIWVGKGKPVADLYVDDRGYSFPTDGDWLEEAPLIMKRIEMLNRGDG